MADYQIITFDSTTGVATLGIPTVPKRLVGLEKLVQIVALGFLRNPGRNVFAPTEGSGLRAEIGKYNYNDGAEIRSLVIQRTKIVEKEILSRQKQGEGDPSERLQSLTVTDVAFDSITGETAVRVRVINELGDSKDFIV